jgi:hypothetical protein
MTRRPTPPTQPSELEIIELIEQANPVAELAPPLSGQALDARVAVIAAAISETPRKRRFRRRRVLIGTGAVVAIFGGGGAITWAVTRHSPAVSPTSIVCYDSPAQSIGVGAQATGESPVDICARVWQQGGLGTGGDVVPNLVACVGSGGAAAVYASEDADLCQHLGLAVLDPVIPPDQLAIIDFTNDITDQIVTMGCIDQPTLIALIDEQLRDKGLDDLYTVRVLRPTDAELPCAAMGPNEADHTIDLLPIPNMFDTVPSS